MAIDLVRSNYAYKYPVERIAAYATLVAAKYPDISQVKALDFGFGGGRHLKLLSDLGYDTYGIDVTQDAIDTTYYNFGEGFIPREKLKIANILEQPVYPDGFFDVLLSVGVVWSFPYQQMVALLDRLFPLIKEGGYFIGNFMSNYNTWTTMEDRKRGEFDYCVRDSGAVWTFIDKEELHRLMQRYSLNIEMIERYERYFESGWCTSYWQITARKCVADGKTANP